MAKFCIINYTVDVHSIEADSMEEAIEKFNNGDCDLVDDHSFYYAPVVMCDGDRLNDEALKIYDQLAKVSGFNSEEN